VFDGLEDADRREDVAGLGLLAAGDAGWAIGRSASIAPLLDRRRRRIGSQRGSGSGG